jgi:hypothetical protein
MSASACTDESFVTITVELMFHEESECPDSHNVRVSIRQRAKRLMLWCYMRNFCGDGNVGFVAYLRLCHGMTTGREPVK